MWEPSQATSDKDINGLVLLASAGCRLFGERIHRETVYVPCGGKGTAPGCALHGSPKVPSDQLGLGIYNVQDAVEGMDGSKRSHLLYLCGQLLRLVLIPCHIQGEPYHWIRSTAISFAAELDGHVLGTLCAVTMALLTNRLDLCIQGLFGAGKSKSMAVLILALLELDVEDSLKVLFICKENSGTRSFADLLLWLDPPSGVLGRIGRLVGDQERNKSSYSHTKFDIHPRERRQMLNKCQLVMATGGTIAQDLTMQWSTLGSFMQDLSLLVIDEGQQYGTDREIAVISLLKQQPLVLWTGDSQQTPGGIAQAAPNAKRSRQLLLAKKTWITQRQELFHAVQLSRSNDQAPRPLIQGRASHFEPSSTQRRSWPRQPMDWPADTTSRSGPPRSKYGPPRPGRAISSCPPEWASPTPQNSGPSASRRHNSKLFEVPCLSCLDTATCSHPPTYGRWPSSSTKLPDSRSQRCPCVGTYASI